MNAKWLALAAQIAALNLQVAELQAERNELAHRLGVMKFNYDTLLAAAEVLKADRDLHKAMCDHHDAQHRAGVIATVPRDDVITINLKELIK